MANTLNLSLRGNKYYFRARVPQALISAYGSPMVSISLDTSDKAEAQFRLRAKRAELDRELEALGRQTQRIADGYRGALLTLTDADVEHICQRYRADRLAGDELQRIAGLSADSHAMDIEVLTDGVSHLRANFARGILDEVYPGLNTWLREIDLRIPRGTAPFQRLARRFQEAEIEVYDAVLQRRQGKAVAIPLAPLSGLSFQDVYDTWLKRKKSRPLKTVRAFEQAFESLAAHCTAMTPVMLRKPDAAALRDRMLATGEQSGRTVQKLLGFLQAAFQCVVDDGRLETNVFVGIKVALDEQETEAKARMPFTVDELQRIFQGSVYLPGFKPRKSLGNACKWLPLMSAFTAARLEELAQLHAEDIQPHPTLGWTIAIHAEGQRQVKTSSSVRDVPVHAELVRFGLLEMVAAVGQGRLFPALRPDKYGKLGTAYSTWFGRYLDELGIDDPTRVFHSFRHTFIEICKSKATTIPPEVREALVGHMSPKEIRAIYGTGKYPLEPMVEVMQKFEIKGLDLSHLYVVSAEMP